MGHHVDNARNILDNVGDNIIMTIVRILLSYQYRINKETSILEFSLPHAVSIEILIDVSIADFSKENFLK